MECYDGQDCVPHVLVVRGDELTLANFRSSPISWNVVHQGRTRLEIAVAARDPDATVDLSGLARGTFKIVDATTQTRVGGLVHASLDDHVTGSTLGNCRYNLDLAPGRYKIVARNPYLIPFEAEATVRPGIITRVNPVFTADNLRE